MKKRNRWTAALVFFIVFSAMSGTAQKQSKSEPPNVDRALGCLRTINTAEVTYMATYNKGYSPTLAALGVKLGATNVTPEVAGLIDENLASGKMAGYLFDYKPGKKDKSGSIITYTVTARPQKWQEGVVSFFSDQSGVIHWTKANRAPTVKDPTLDSLIDSKQQ